MVSGGTAGVTTAGAAVPAAIAACSLAQVIGMDPGAYSGGGLCVPGSSPLPRIFGMDARGGLKE